jgi:hypothetical protein
MISVAFITCVNNQSIYEQCLAYLARLDKQGFSVEYIPVQDSVSITRAYNRAMSVCTAKYKVYLHQDTFIVEPLFLQHIHNIFSSDPSIGMIGLLGGRKMPGGEDKLLCWTECEEIYGNVYVPRADHHVRGILTSNPYEWVSVVDGFIMVTQYDLPWREDIINGFHFYDKSQSFEFWKKNYKVVVPRMENCWVYHLCSQNYDSEYYRLRKVFYGHYKQFLSPAERKRLSSLSFKGKKFVFSQR